MEAALGSSIGVFIGVTVCLLGFAAFLMGQNMAANWRRPRWVAFFAILLGGAARFLTFALFEERLLHLPGFLLSTATLIGIAFFAYQITRAYIMVTQYPWLYERVGLFSWKPKDHPA